MPLDWCLFVALSKCFCVFFWGGSLSRFLGHGVAQNSKFVKPKCGAKRCANSKFFGQDLGGFYGDFKAVFVFFFCQFFVFFIIFGAFFVALLK